MLAATGSFGLVAVTHLLAMTNMDFPMPIYLRYGSPFFT